MIYDKVRGFDEYLHHNNTISFIEWAEKVPNLLQLADWQINLSIDNNNNRHMEITAKSTQQNGVV